MKKAVLLLNLGGPEKLEDVRAFLYRLFIDPEIIRVKFTPLRRFIAWAISTSREKKSQSMYAKIGGGSPIRRLTDGQSQALESVLKNKKNEVIVRTAFTCSDPLVEDVVKECAQNGVQQFLNLPLYPQYSLTTTKGALDRTREAVHKFAPGAALYESPSFPIHPLFIQAHVDLINKEKKKFSSNKDEDIYLLFSAHSIPEKLVTDEGDPYQKEMNQTVDAVIKKCNWNGPYSLSWQSKLGPVKWLSPSTEDSLINLGKKGQKRVLIVPIAFVTDHIETIFEIDQELAETAKNSGIVEFFRTPGLNEHPDFIACLADLVKSNRSFWEES